MKQNFKNVMTIFIGIIFSLTLTCLIVNHIASKTLLDKAWILGQGDTNRIYEQYSEAVDNYLSDTLYHQTGIEFQFNGVMQGEELKEGVVYKTEQKLAYRKNKMPQPKTFDITVYQNRIVKQVESLGLSQVQIDRILKTFSDELREQFYSSSTNLEVNHIDKTIWVIIIDILTTEVVIIFITVLCAICFVIMTVLWYKTIVEWLIYIVFSLLMSGGTLILLFILAHNIYFDISRVSISSIKTHFIQILFNELFRLLYSWGYYLLVTTLLMYSILFVYKLYKNAYIKI